MTVRRSMTRMMLMIMMMQMILQVTGAEEFGDLVIMMMDTMMPMITGRTRWMIKHLEYVGQMI